MKTSILLSVVILAILVISLFLFKIIERKRRININIGVLYTTEGGSMAPYEKELYNRVMHSIKFFNKIQDKYYINTFEYNPQSETDKYVKGIEMLINKHDPTMIIGVWRSIDRKAVIPVLEKTDNLLCYAVQYEGNECSRNILYFGATPNQQTDIAIEYAIKNISNNVILIGSDYVFPRTANEIMKSYIKKYNANLIMEKYVSLDEQNFSSICDEILKNNKKCVIINTINGDSNKYFFTTLNKKFKSIKQNNNAIRSNQFPIVSLSIPESIISGYNIDDIYGDYHIWNYSQKDSSFNTFLSDRLIHNNPKLNKLIKNFKDSKKVIGDPEYHSFLITLFFFSFLLSYEGPNYDSTSLRNEFLKYKEKVITPTGYLQLNDNNHLDNFVYILKIGLDKRYETIYRTPVEIKPNPWYNQFSSVKFQCDNLYSFMGSKYKI